MNLTFKQAKELSIKKWEYIVENDGSDKRLLTNLPELGELFCICGFCEKYYYTSSKSLDLCAKCPIRPKLRDCDLEFKDGCSQISHPFHKWYYNKTQENAQAVLDLIKNSKPR